LNQVNWINIYFFKQFISSQILLKRIKMFFLKKYRVGRIWQNWADPALAGPRPPAARRRRAGLADQRGPAASRPGAQTGTGQPGPFD
jgi:hypothetical protein